MLDQATCGDNKERDLALLRTFGSGAFVWSRVWFFLSLLSSALRTIALSSLTLLTQSRTADVKPSHSKARRKGAAGRQKREHEHIGSFGEEPQELGLELLVVPVCSMSLDPDSEHHEYALSTEGQAK
jgi:hypothetical protein